jgi:hypothetical protein
MSVPSTVIAAMAAMLTSTRINAYSAKLCPSSFLKKTINLLSIFPSYSGLKVDIPSQRAQARKLAYHFVVPDSLHAASNASSVPNANGSHE